MPDPTDGWDGEDDQPARPFIPTPPMAEDGPGVEVPRGDGTEAPLDFSDIVSGQRQSAIGYHVLYSDFIEAGFTAEQALVLTGQAITKQMEINAVIWMNERRRRGG